MSRFCLPTLDGFTLVIIMFPFSDPQKQFGSRPWDRPFKGTKVIPVPLVSWSSFWFAFYEEGACDDGLDLGSRYCLPHKAGNVDIAKPNFAIFYLRKAIFLLMRAARTLCFSDLCPRQHHPFFQSYPRWCSHVSPLFCATTFPSALCHVWLLSSATSL